MILPFSTQINGKPSYFPERIWQGIIKHNILPFPEGFTDAQKVVHSERIAEGYLYHRNDICLEMVPLVEPKLHTFRADSSNQWRAGRKIHPVINNRSPNMFKFCPELPCVSTQEAIIKHGLGYITVIIDGIMYETAYDDVKRIAVDTDPKIEELALNDGFDNTDDFFNYFKDDFKGKIIHWSDLKY